MNDIEAHHTAHHKTKKGAIKEARRYLDKYYNGTFKVKGYHPSGMELYKRQDDGTSKLLKKSKNSL